MIIERKACETIVAVELMHGDIFDYILTDGSRTAIELVDTGADIIYTTLKKTGVEEPGAMTPYRFWGDFLVNGREYRLEREVGTQKSFYEPRVIGGVSIWLDAVDAIFDFIRETHGQCRLQENFSTVLPPRRHARLALQQSGVRICPETIYPWCPLPEEGLKIEHCFRGEDCWLGAYNGASAHGGLDINHPEGTPLFAPINLDYHFLYNSVGKGSNNNRWKGFRRWQNGSEWILRSAHMTSLTVPEYAPLQKGMQYAEGAGVHVGGIEHSHFAFSVFNYGELIHLDPWILFRQMYLDSEN